MSNSPQSVWSTPPKVAPSPSEDHSTLKKYSPDSHASVLLKEVLKEDYDEETKAFQDEEEEEAEESSNNTDHVSYKFSPTLPSSTVETEISLVVPTQGGTNPMELPLATEDNPTSPQKAKDIPSVLLRVPNTAFGIPMGLAGNAYMWKMVENATFLPVQTSLACTILWFASFIVGVIISFLYIYKVFWNFHMVVQEYQHPSRNPFFHGPLLTFLLLSLGIPPAIHVSSLCLQILFGIGLLFQSVTTLITMKKSLSHAKPQFVLSILGWFLLSLLGQQANASEIWGIDLPTFCLGIGGIQFIMVFGNVWNGWHRHNSPALLLLLAPPSVAVLAVNGYGENDEFSLTSLAILGWAIGFAIFLMRYARSLTKNSSELGTYFAYVYPLAALSSAILQYSLVEQTMATKILATISMTLATIAILCVFFRMIYQMVLCFYYKSHWGDPLLGIVPSNRKRNVVTERQEQP